MDRDDFLAERAMFPARVDDHIGSSYEGTTERRKNVDFLRLKDSALLLVDPRPGIEIFEFGCSAGAELVYCGLQGATVYGVDLDPALVEQANRKLAYLGISGEAVVADAAEVPFEDGRFDVVLSSDFHEHLDPTAQLAFFAEGLRLLKPGGHLVLKTPNLSYLRVSLAYKRLGRLLCGKDPRGLVIPHTPGTQDPQHIGLVSRRDVDLQLASTGFQNWKWQYPPLRRFGQRYLMETASSELPVVRDWLCEDLLVQAWKPIAYSHFPD